MALLSSVLSRFYRFCRAFVYIDSWKYCLCSWCITFLINSKISERIHTYIGQCNLRGKIVDSYFIPRTSHVHVIRLEKRVSLVFKISPRHLFRLFLQLVVSIHDEKYEKRTRICVYLRVTNIWKFNARIGFVKNLSPNSPAEKKLQRQNRTEGKIS